MTSFPEFKRFHQSESSRKILVVLNDSFQRIAFIWAKIGQKIGFITNKLEASGVLLRSIIHNSLGQNCFFAKYIQKRD